MKLILLLVVFLILVIPPVFGQISDKTGLKQDFQIETGGYDFTVNLVSSFNVENIEFSSDDKRLTFYINTGIENNLGEIQIPTNLINGNFTFFLNDQEIFPVVRTNEKISFIIVEFKGDGRHQLDVIGTTYLPEFSEIAPMILSMALIVVIFSGKLKKLVNHSFNKD